MSRVFFYCVGLIHWHGGYAEGSAGLPFAYGDSDGVPFLTNSFHGKKNVAQMMFHVFYVSKKSPTGPTERTPKKPEYLIARSQLTKRGPLGFGPIQCLMECFC